MEPRQRSRQPFLGWGTDALEFIRVAFEPIKRLQTFLRVVIPALGLTIAGVVGWFRGWAWTLVALVVVLAFLFLVAGARLVHSNIDLADVEVNGHEMRLDVLNEGVRHGRFTATIVKVEPLPPKQPAKWPIQWELDPDAFHVEIPGRGRRTLLLGRGELSRRADGMLAGSVAFFAPQRGEILIRNFNGESDDDYQTYERTKIKIQVDRLDQAGHVERCYEITLPYEDARTGFAHPKVTEIGDFGQSASG